MRHPLTHEFLLWAGPTLVGSIAGCLGLIAALAQSFPKVGPWAERVFDQWWPIVTVPWFALSFGVLVVAYIGALIFTAQPAPVRKTGLMAVKPMSRRERRADNAFRQRIAGASPEEARQLMADELVRLRAPKEKWWRRLRPGSKQPRSTHHASPDASLEPALSNPDAGAVAAGRSVPNRSWITLDDAIRYLGQKSQWAESRSQTDPHFSIYVGQQLQDALACGDLAARGRKFHVLRGGIKDPPLHPLALIPTGFWETARIDAYWALQGRVQNIASGRGESAVRNGEYEGMHDIRLDRRQVEALWPPRPDAESDEVEFREAFDEIASDRIPFVRLRTLSADLGITLERFGRGQNNGYAIEGALKEAAANGRLGVWGRPYNGPVRDNDPLVPIPPEHFLRFSFRHGNLEYGTENVQSGTATMEMLAKGLPGIEGVTFYDLHLSLHQTKGVLRSVKASCEER